MKTRSLLCIALAGLSAAAQGQQPADGAGFTAAQAAAGQTLYGQHCAACHGAALEGLVAVPLSGPMFRKTWSRANVNTDDLHYIITTTMPPQGRDMLNEARYLEILAFILQRNGVAAGSTPLTADRRQLLALRMNADDVAAAPLSLPGVRSAPLGSGPSRADLLHAADDPDNWLYHTRDFRGTRYSPLARIDAGNAARLRPECLYQVGDIGNFQNGPIVHDGTLYVTGIYTTAAIDAATCRPKWRHEWQRQDREGQLSNRGVAIQDGYVVRGTTDGYLFALDAQDGKLLWAHQAADPWEGEAFTMPPMIVNDRILIGPAGSERAVSGWLGAFRLQDGAPLWRFNTVPGATRAGSETWGNPTGIPLGGGATWTPMSFDAGLDELYVAVANPAPDMAPGTRPGANLYTNSIVALDVDTGKLRWYRQFVPADEHDWDHTQVSPIFRARVEGRDRTLIANTGKDGILRVLDQQTHDELFRADVARRENFAAPVTVDGTFACPGLLGGVEWNGPAWHPGQGLLITPAVNNCGKFFTAPQVRYVDGELYMGGEFVADPAYWSGWITAVDAGTGALRWRYESPAPVVAAVTTTAGNLVLAGELSGDFLVLDVANGKPLYRFNTGGPIGGGVITYAVDGRQYIAVASGRPSPLWAGEHPGAATIVVFALPPD